MKLKSNAAEGHSAAHLRDAGVASMYLHCSTVCKGAFLCDAKMGALC